MSNLKSHFHITMENISTEQLIDISKQFNAKATPIDLVRNKQTECDRMITMYQKGIDVDYPKEIGNKINSLGYKVKRIKVEQYFSNFDEMIPYVKNLSNENYFEFHIKIKNGIELQDSLHDEKMYVISKNSITDEYIFLNYRAYNEKDYLNFIEDLIRLYKNYQPVSIHKEFLIYDSNKNVDSGWI